MNLDEAQRQRVTAWILEGAKLSEIQTRLAQEFGLRLTYMEVRLLVDDLKLTPKDQERPPDTAPMNPAPTAPATQPVAARTAPPAGVPAPGAGGGVSVTVDKITRPGAVVSGKVTFSDGQSGAWYLDQLGRLAVAPLQQGYKPSAADVQQFQAALDREMAKMGY